MTYLEEYEYLIRGRHVIAGYWIQKEIENLTKTYGNKKAVDNLSLHIQSGEIYGFIGHNGAGKTTTLKACCGILGFDSGEIYVNGISVKKHPIAAKKLIAYIPDNPDLYEFMTGIRYLNFVADVFGVSADDRNKKIKKYAEIFALTDETYSLVCSDTLPVPKEQRNRYYLLVSMFNHLYWIMGSVLGAVVGSLISFNTRGIDFALTALFVTVFWDQWLSNKKHAPALIGVGASVLCLILFGADSFLIPAMLLIALLLLLTQREVTHA